MAKKVLKCAIVAVIIFLAIYNSVYFRKLSEVKAEAKKDFNAAGYAQTMFNKLPSLTDKATTIDELITSIRTDKKKAFLQYGHALAIGSKRYFLIKGQGIVSAVNEGDVTLSTPGHNEVDLATEFIFGNSIRDASGLINLNNFSNTNDLNNISAELNKIVREKVLPPFKNNLHTGRALAFTGAVELNEEHLNLNNVEVVPISLTVK